MAVKVDAELRGEKLRLQKAVKLAELLLEQHAVILDALTDLRAIVAGEVTLADKTKRIENFWCETWAAFHGASYTWMHGRDNATVHRLLKTLPVEEIKYRMARFIQNRDLFFVQKGHTFAIFVATINQHAAPVSLPDLTLDAPVTGCTHVPRCESDQIHTQRRSAEVRA